MKSRSIPMGAVPGWVMGGAHRGLTLRFMYAARSWVCSSSIGPNNKLRLFRHGKSVGLALEQNSVARPLHPFSCWNSRFLNLPRDHQRKQERHFCQAMPDPYQTFRFISINFLFSSTSVKGTRSLRGLRSLRSSRSARPHNAAGKGAKGGDAMQRGDSKYIDWWEQKMNQCQKPSTRELIKRLVSNNILGLDTTLRNGKMKAGGFNSELLEVKRRFPHEVILRRVGDFYESSGFDACVLAEYAGLNPMGGLINPTTVPRAGCPIENLRQTLDALTRNGFSVCIVEEVKGPSNAKGRKERFVSGHAHPGSPYVYGLAEADFDVDFPDPLSIIGIARSASGYCLICVVELMRTLLVEDQLTEEAVVAKLRAKPFQRLFLHKSLRDQSTETVRWGEFGEGGLLWAECRGQDSEWYESDPVSELLSKVREIYDIEADIEFRRIVSPPGLRPRPLSIGTASQVGILPTQGVPSLLRVLLPPDMNGLCIAYLRDLLLNPPPYRVADCIQKALRIMIDVDRPIPDFHCVSAAKLVKLIGAEEANHLEFARIKNMAEDVLLMENDKQLTVLLDLLLDPTWLATGLRLDRDHLVKDCNFLVKRLDEVLAPTGDPSNAISSSKFIPDEFFQDMEVRWKERVRREHVEKAYSDVDRAAASLSDAIEADFHPIVLRTKGLAAPMGGGAGGASGEICYSTMNRAVWFKGKRFRPTVLSGGPGEEEIKALKDAKDSKGKKVGEEWFTTDRVDNALEYYRSAVERASTAVLELLKSVAGELQCKLNAIVFVATVSIIAKTMFAHVSEAKRRRWVLPELSEELSERGAGQGKELVRNGNTVKKSGQASSSIYLEDMFPYWLDKTQDQVVLNTIQLESVFLLTGPNGGGKSSVLRSICATTLLATCGLMVPSRIALVPRLDSIMLRMMIADSPADCKSSFQMEMSELRTILSEATERSLVLVDELCKGTEVNKGTFIVASVLEHLDHAGCLGVISTHLHGLLDMDLNVQRVVLKAMGVQFVDSQPRPTWRLVDGVCRDSLAFETARKEGVPESVLNRAEEFFQEWSQTLHTGTIGQEESHGGGKGHYVDVSICSKELQVIDKAVASRESPKSSIEDLGNDTDVDISDGNQGSGSQNPIPCTALEFSRGESLLAESGQFCCTVNGSSAGREDVTGSTETMHVSEEANDTLDDLQHVLLRICKTKLSEFPDFRLSGNEVYCQCFVVGPRQKPPPLITNHSCVYILQRPDGRLYVGQTDNMSGRMEKHRTMPGLHEAPFLYVPLPGKSVACELETCLIKQLPSYGFSVVNKADQNHRYFGTASFLRNDSEEPPF